MAHTLLVPAGLQRAGGRHPARRTSTGTTRPTFDAAYSKLTAALRPWTIDFHVAQNDATVHGSGTHDKTGRHCLPNDPNGKLDIVQRRRLLAPRRRAASRPRRFQHICWDGCMFPNAVDDEARKRGTTSSRR